MSPNRIDTLRTRAQELDNAQTDQQVKDAYANLDALVSNAAIADFSKQEKLLVSEAMQRNRAKIEQHVIEARLTSLDMFEKKLEQVSVLDFGDHVGDLKDKSAEVLQSGLVLGGSVLDAGKDAAIATSNNAAKGVGITLDYARSLVKEGKEKHPVALGAFAVAGGAVSVWGLMKLYKWVNSSPDGQEKPSFWRRTARALGLGAVATGALALVGINAQTAVANAPTNTAGNSPQQTPNTPASAPTPAPAPTPTPALSLVEVLNTVNNPVDLASIPHGVNILDLHVPMLVDGKEVQFATGGWFGAPSLTINGDTYEIQDTSLKFAVKTISSIQRQNDGLNISGWFITDAAFVQLVHTVDDNQTSTAQLAYQDAQQQAASIDINFKKI